MMMHRKSALGAVGALGAFLAFAPLQAQEVKVDLSKETVGKTPQIFEPFVGTWIVAQDGPDKVIKVDGSPWKAAQDNPTKLLVESARKIYGSSNEDLMDNAKEFAHYPVAVLRTVDNFSNGTISMKFKTIAGDLDRCSGILFNVKPNGDWLVVRYNDTEHNVVMWEFHNGVRRYLNHHGDGNLLTAAGDRDKWHELKIGVDGGLITAWLDGTQQWTYTLDSPPGPQRRGAPPNPDLIAANNPVLQPPVKGKVGLWSKTDSSSEFKDYVVSGK